MTRSGFLQYRLDKGQGEHIKSHPWFEMKAVKNECLVLKLLLEIVGQVLQSHFPIFKTLSPAVI